MKNKLFLFILLGISNMLSAQLYEFSINLGFSNYVGDVGRTNYIYPSNGAGGVSFKYNWNPRITFRTSFLYLPIEGNDANADSDFKKDRNISFRNALNEIALGIEFNFYEYNISEVSKTWTPYILLEVAGFSYKEATQEIAPKVYSYQSKNGISVPVGVGFKSLLSGSVAFAIETKFAYTFTDDLDYTTENIPSLNFGGNSDDWYMFTGVSLIYTFGRPPCYKAGF